MKLKYIINFAVVILILNGISCKEKPTEPPVEEFPPGYQHDIPWPSLADSPWPMNHADPQSTGRSKYKGPKLGQIEWEIDSLYMKSGISIGSDGTIYFISLEKKGLFAINPDGTIKWILENIINNAYAVTTPLIGKDGTIYIGDGLNGKLYSINPDGTVKWQINTLGFIYHVGINIGIEGNIYLLNGSTNSAAKLVSVNKNGIIERVYENDKFDYGTSSGLSFSPDGKTIYIPGTGPSLFALNTETNELKWSFGNSRYQASPVIDSYGNIYLISRTEQLNDGNTAVYCLLPDGNVK